MQKANETANAGWIKQLNSFSCFLSPKFVKIWMCILIFFSVLIFQAWMKHRKGRILPVAPTATKHVEDTEASFQFSLEHNSCSCDIVEV